MDLFLYKTGENAPLLALEDVASYTDSQAVTADGAVFGPFAEDTELSSLPDCSETLRADWRGTHPTQEERMEELETLMAGLLFGGEAE